MSEDTKQFCEDNGPFRVHHLATPHFVHEWVVRDVTGFAAAECADEDAARAIADALNGARANKTKG